MNNDSPSISPYLLRIAGVFGFVGVALGAFGAHALAGHLATAGRVETWETAVLYNLVHAVALLALALGGRFPRRIRVGKLWALGILIFSGSLYLLCLTGMSWLGAVTPVGGLCLLAGWALLLFAGTNPEKDHRLPVRPPERILWIRDFLRCEE